MPLFNPSIQSHVQVFSNYQSSQRRQTPILSRPAHAALRVGRRPIWLHGHPNAGGPWCCQSTNRNTDAGKRQVVPGACCQWSGLTTKLKSFTLKSPSRKCGPSQLTCWHHEDLQHWSTTTLSIERAAELFGNRIDGEKESVAMVIYTDGAKTHHACVQSQISKPHSKITRISLVGTSPLWVHRWKHLP